MCTNNQTVKRFALFLFSILILCMISCQNANKKVVTPSFYHWQTKLDISPEEEDYLKKLRVKQLYVKFFDVDWDPASKDVVPLAELEVGRLPTIPLSIIPVIFITNRSLLNLPSAGLPKLSARIRKKVLQHWQKLPSHLQLQELQLDCDWSGQSRAAFFELLELLRKDFSKEQLQLSATIRLHQYKYPQQTGIPPIDRGTLMFYNMGKLDTIGEHNSILDIGIARRYVKNSGTYPLPLDLALPLFRWGVLFRDSKMIRLVNDLSAEQLADTSRFLKKAATVFEVIKSTYLEGHYLYKGDQIRLEDSPAQQLEAAVQLLNPHLNTDSLHLIFYHLDSAIIKRYSYEKLDHICAFLEQVD